MNDLAYLILIGVMLGWLFHEWATYRARQKMRKRESLIWKEHGEKMSKEMERLFEMWYPIEFGKEKK